LLGVEFLDRKDEPRRILRTPMNGYSCEMLIRFMLPRLRSIEIASHKGVVARGDCESNPVSWHEAVVKPGDSNRNLHWIAACQRLGMWPVSKRQPHDRRRGYGSAEIYRSAVWIDVIKHSHNVGVGSVDGYKALK
jgi:hypothetical protein